MCTWLLSVGMVRESYLAIWTRLVTVQSALFHSHKLVEIGNQFIETGTVNDLYFVY